MNLRVKIKRVKDVELPKYAREFDSGFDLVAAEDVIIKPGETKVIPTGLAFEIPPGYELQVRPRSGISGETKLRVVLGTIDSGYRGEVGVIVDNNNDKGPHMTRGIWTIDGKDLYEVPDEMDSHTYIIRKGDRLAQGVICPVVTANFIESEILSESVRGENGFGSTGV